MTKMWTRRRAMQGIGLGVSAVAFAGAADVALADQDAVDAKISEMFSGQAPVDGAVTIDLPEIAENGGTVPFSVSVDSPMTSDDYVKAIHVFAVGNPRPEVASFSFSPASGVAKASSRMRLAKTQKIVAVAEMSDGRLIQAHREVKVTIGGCGG